MALHICKHTSPKATNWLLSNCLVTPCPPAVGALLSRHSCAIECPWGTATWTNVPCYDHTITDIVNHVAFFENPNALVYFAKRTDFHEELLVSDPKMQDAIKACIEKAVSMPPGRRIDNMETPKMEVVAIAEMMLGLCGAEFLANGDCEAIFRRFIPDEFEEEGWGWF